MEHGLTSFPDIAAVVGRHDVADVRLALVRIGDDWRVWHGEAVLGSARAARERLWRYGRVMFVEQRLAAVVVEGLLGQEPQDLAG